MSAFQTVTAAYFSPTGGTKKAAEILAGAFSPKEAVRFVDLTLPQGRAGALAFAEKDLLIAACPVYAGQMPHVDGLFSNLKGDNTPCVLAAAYGNRHYDDALAQMKAQMERQGFRVIGAAAMIIPHIFSGKLGAGRPDETDKKQLEAFAKAVLAKWEKGDAASCTVPGNPSPEKRKAPPVPKERDAALCTSCGVCAELCPVEAVDLHTYDIDETKCISCMRCTKVCPEKARSFQGAQIQAFLESQFTKPREIELFL